MARADEGALLDALNADLETRFSESVASIGAGIDRLQETNAELIDALDRLARLVRAEPFMEADDEMASACWHAETVLAKARGGAASADTHPKDGDVQQAPLVSGAAPEGGDAQ